MVSFGLCPTEWRSLEHKNYHYNGVMLISIRNFFIDFCYNKQNNLLHIFHTCVSVYLYVYVHAYIDIGEGMWMSVHMCIYLYDYVHRVQVFKHRPLRWWSFRINVNNWVKKADFQGKHSLLDDCRKNFCQVDPFYFSFSLILTFSFSLSVSLYIYIYIYKLHSNVAVCIKEITIYRFVYLFNRLIGLVGWVFANSPGDLGSIPGRVIPKSLKCYLMPLCLNNQQ